MSISIIVEICYCARWEAVCSLANIVVFSQEGQEETELGDSG